MGTVIGEACGQDLQGEQRSGDDRPVIWTERGLVITRLLLVSDAVLPVWNVEGCYGVLEGKPVTVRVPFERLPKTATKKALYKHVSKSGVYIRGIFTSVHTK